MSKTTYEQPLETYPPLVVAAPVFDEDMVLAVVVDEEIPIAYVDRRIDDHDEDDVDDNQSITVERTRSQSRASMSIYSQVRKTHKTIRWNAIIGTLLMVLGISFFIGLARYCLIPTTLTSERCSMKSSSMEWEATIVVDVGELHLISMNNKGIVGMKGQTMLETHSLLSDDVQIQYMGTNVQSLTLTHSGILVGVQNDHTVMFQNDQGIWRTIRDVQLSARVLDSNGKSLALGLGDDVYVYDAQSRKQYVTSMNNVTCIKSTQDGSYLYVATDSEVRYFKNEQEEWIAQETLWRISDHIYDGRKVQESALNQNHTELDVSANGSLVAILSSTGHVLFYAPVDKWMKELGGGGGMDAIHISVSSNGRRVAVARKSDSVLILERKENSMVVVGEIQSAEVRRMNFQENRLQIIDGEVMTIHENKCDSIHSA